MNDASRAYREMGEKGTAQAKEMYEKMTAATSEATDVIKESFSTALNGAQDYNNKLLDFAQTNANTAFEFAKGMLDAKSPSEFIELSTERARQQFATLTEQVKELATLAQKVTLASTEPLKASVTKAFGRSS
jgi:phasin